MHDAVPPRKVDACGFQFGAVHEDLSGGFFKVFSELNMTSRGYFNQRIRDSKGDFFELFPYPGAEISYPSMVGRPAWDAIVENVKAEDPKVLFFNTFQRGNIFKWAEQFNLPTLGVVHNARKFARDEVCVSMAQDERYEAFCLSPHVADKLVELVPGLAGRTHVHYPYAWMPEGADRYETGRDCLDIVIPGAVTFMNRDFEGLLDYLEADGDNASRPFRLSILAGGPDRGRLEEEIANRKLDRFFNLAPLDPETRRVPHPYVLRKLYTCDAILPLLPAGRQDYLTSKVTTGIMTALGIARPIIAPPAVGKAYGFTPIELPADRPFDLTSADLSEATLADRRRESLEIREKGLADNHTSLKRVLQKHSVI